jgi:pimeloyl-ACP methyl ester carboxylesterase
MAERTGEATARPMDTEPARVRVNGVELAYLAAGRPDDPLVLCLHGFPDSAVTWRHLTADLVAAGWRVAAPWLRGYPPSEVVAGPYQVAALARDAVALADALSPDRPVALVGHDWGALATYGAAVLAPQRWSRAVTLSVPPTAAFRPFLRTSPEQQRRSWYMFFFQVAALADAVVRADDLAFVERLWRDWSPGWEPDGPALAAARASIASGFPAALDFYRDTWQPARQDPALAQDQLRIAEEPVPVPTLVLHGLDDGCILPGAFAGAGACFAGEHGIEPVPGVGHFLHLEAPQVVNPKIVSFLKG